MSRDGHVMREHSISMRFPSSVNSVRSSTGNFAFLNNSGKNVSNLNESEQQISHLRQKGIRKAGRKTLPFHFDELCLVNPWV